MTIYRRIRIVALSAILCVQATSFSAQQKPQSDGVFRINVNLVQVDAIVTDSKGQPVKNLQPEDFELRQDGKLQKITNFSYIDVKESAVITASSLPAARPVKGSIALPPSPPSENRRDQIRRTIALVVDDLALSFESSVRVRDSLRRWVDKEMRPGDLAAVVRTSAGMGVLQQFTNDKRMLYAAIEHVRYHLGRVGVTSFAPLTGARPEGSIDTAVFNDKVEEAYTLMSLNAIQYVLRGLRDFPGRKSLILFSESMRLQFREELNLVDTPVTSRHMTDIRLRKLTDAAHRYSVVIYAVDPRGVAYTGLTAEDNTSGMQPEAVAQVSGQRTQQMIDSQDGMVNLVQKTGGLFLHNSNDISGLLSEAVDDGDGYYLLGYQPAASTFSEKTAAAKFHDINVRVKRAGLRVRSRTGFFGTPDERAAPPPKTWQEQIASALSSPFTTSDVRVRLTTLFSHGVKEGSYINALLFFDARDLTFGKEPDGSRTALVDIAAATFDEEGRQIDGAGKTWRFRLQEDTYEEVLGKGLVYSTLVPVKKAGAYQMRAAVRDTSSGRIGSATQFTEIPDIKNGRLALSGIVLAAEQLGATDTGDPLQGWAAGGDPNGTPAVRVFRQEEAIVYSFEILNARFDREATPQLEVQTLLFRDRQQVHAETSTLSTKNPPNPKQLLTGDRMSLEKFSPGFYTLQVVVTDKLAAESQRIAAQSMDFEIRQ